MALLILGVGAVALAIVQSESPAWSAGELWVAAAVGAGRWPPPSWPGPASRRSRWWTWRCSSTSYRYANLATLSFGIAFAMMFFAFFFYMMGVWHYSLPKAGLAVTPGPLLVMPTAIVTGRLAARMGHRPFLVGGALLYAVAGLWFLLVPGAEPDYLGAWLPGLVLSGLSVGMVLPSLAGAAVSRLPAQHYAVGSAVNQATRQIGAVLGVAITVLLLGRGAEPRVLGVAITVPAARGLSHADFDPLYMAHGAGLADGRCGGGVKGHGRGQPAAGERRADDRAIVINMSASGRVRRRRMPARRRARRPAASGCEAGTLSTPSTDISTSRIRPARRARCAWRALILRRAVGVLCQHPQPQPTWRSPAVRAPGRASGAGRG